MRRLCSTTTVRRAEAGTGVDEPVLMARAATALADLCAQLLRDGRGAVRGAAVLAVIGTGNNGGDALWALAMLARRGVATTAVGEVGRMHPEGAAAARAAGTDLLDWADPRVAGVVADADLALDGIVGISGRGGLRGPAADLVHRIEAAGVPVVAVDVPSGVDSDTGLVPGAAVSAVATACFGVLKPGLLLAPGRDRAGVVTVIDIGLRDTDLEPAAWALELSELAVAPLDPSTHKYRRGVVEVVAGSATFPGAAVLAVGGARRAGAGLIGFTSGEPRTGLADPVAALVVSHYPDVVLGGDRRPDARCVGPGLGEGAGATEVVLAALADPAPLVLDASGLRVLERAEGRAALAARAEQGWVTVLTPHAGEARRLGLELSGGWLTAARRAADELGVVVVLKGPATVIAAPGGPAYVDVFGTAALATAGTGDILAGLLAGGLAARAVGGQLDAVEVAHLCAQAVGRHGLAGRLAAEQGGHPTAADVLAALPAALRAADTTTL